MPFEPSFGLGASGAHGRLDVSCITSLLHFTSSAELVAMGSSEDEGSVPSHSAIGVSHDLVEGVVDADSD